MQSSSDNNITSRITQLQTVTYAAATADLTRVTFLPLKNFVLIL